MLTQCYRVTSILLFAVAIVTCWTALTRSALAQTCSLNPNQCEKQGGACHTTCVAPTPVCNMGYFVGTLFCEGCQSHAN